jgi:hypothetical protein
MGRTRCRLPDVDYTDGWAEPDVDYTNGWAELDVDYTDGWAEGDANYIDRWADGSEAGDLGLDVHRECSGVALPLPGLP